ncbi:hypothetical protein RZS08_44350, partial [Arthrospira platensis SPKY1]|nr:hypothetical protein [Arthrospira platensis SPKY1]
MKNLNNNNFVKAGLDFYADDKNTLSFYTVQSMNNNFSHFRNTIFYTNGVNPTITQNFDARNQGTNQIYNLGYKHKFDNPQKTLDIEANFNRNVNPEDSRFADGVGTILQTNQIENIGDNLIINADFV